MKLIATRRVIKMLKEGRVKNLWIPTERKGETAFWNSELPNELWCEFGINKHSISKSERNDLSDRTICQLVIAMHEKFGSGGEC